MIDEEQQFGAFEEPVEKGKKLIGLKHSAYKDYISARILFLNDQLHQASIFANTCIEKEIKARLYALGIECKIKHNTFKLLNLLNSHDPKTTSKINFDFIKVLAKIYESRYHEGLNPGYNFVIIRNKFLAELDYTYSLLEEKVRFRMGSAGLEMPKTLYQIAVMTKNPAVVENNFLFNNLTKEQFLQLQDFVFEFRILFNHELIEAAYMIPRNDEPTTFIYEALVSEDQERTTFKISNHYQGITKINIFRNGILQSTAIT